MFSGISAAQVFIVLLVITIFFGGKKIRQLGSDLGASIRDFRRALSDSDDKNAS